MRKKIRTLFLFSHRWFGLIAGFHFVLLGLSGSYLVYRDELDALLYPSLMKAAGEVPQANGSMELARVISVAKAGLLTEKDPLIIQYPGDSNRNIALRFNMAGAGERRRFVTAYVDPSNGGFAGSISPRNTLGGWLFSFHHDMFWGPTGRTIIAVGGVLMLIVLLSGLYLWWPKNRSVWRALRLAPMRTFLQANLEIHKASGIYSLLLMIAVTFTGVFVTRPDWFLGKKPERREQASALARDEVLAPNYAGVDQFLKENGLTSIISNVRFNSRSSSIDVELDHDDKPIIQFDADTGHVKSEAAPVLAVRDRVHRLNHDIHAGYFWGELGRFLIFVSGILPVLFYVTGFVIWIKKRARSKNQPL